MIDIIENKDPVVIDELVEAHLLNIIKKMDVLEEKFPHYFEKE